MDAPAPQRMEDSRSHFIMEASSETSQNPLLIVPSNNGSNTGLALRRNASSNNSNSEGHSHDSKMNLFRSQKSEYLPVPDGQPLSPSSSTDGSSSSSSSSPPSSPYKSMDEHHYQQPQPQHFHHNDDDKEEGFPSKNTTTTDEGSSFKDHFFGHRGPREITLVILLFAIGLGSTIGVIPSVMSDRFARLDHGYVGAEDCSEFADRLDEKPSECFDGSASAQSAVATSNLIQNLLTFLTSSLIGSLSDEFGRRGVLMAGFSLGLLPAVALCLIQVYPTMSPWWYYAANAATGLVNWLPVALSTIADCLPRNHRAPGNGLLLAGFLLGFSFSPILAFVLDHAQLSLVSLGMGGLALAATCLRLPETLPPSVAEQARNRRRRQQLREDRADAAVAGAIADRFDDNDEPSDRFDDDEPDDEEEDHHVRVVRTGYPWPTTTSCYHPGRPPRWALRLCRALLRPFQEMSILNRDRFFRSVSVLVFLTGMVSSGDRILLVYYIEERLGFTTQDVSVMFLIIGLLGLVSQGLILKPLKDKIGEKMVIAVCFLLGAIDNTMYGLATHKATIYAGVALSALASMAYPTISAINANNVSESEQGRIQGALTSLQALSSGAGPILLTFVYRQAKETPLGPGGMFVFAGMLYLVAVVSACALPTDRTNTNHSSTSTSTSTKAPAGAGGYADDPEACGSDDEHRVLFGNDR